MSEDLISNNFVDNVNSTIIKRNFIISKLLLVLCICWSLIVLIDWYLILQGGNADMIHGTNMVYTYVILPISDIVVIGLSVYAYILIVKAYRCIEGSLEQSNGSLMSEGFTHFYTSNILTVISYIISILTMIMNFFFKL